MVRPPAMIIILRSGFSRSAATAIDQIGAKPVLVATRISRLSRLGRKCAEPYGPVSFTRWPGVMRLPNDELTRPSFMRRTWNQTEPPFGLPRKGWVMTIGTARITAKARLHILPRAIGQCAVRADADFDHFGRQEPQRAQHAFDGADTRRLAPLDHRIADNPALTGMNDARLAPFAAVHFAGYQPHAAGAAMAGAAVMGQVDAVAQSCVQQHLAAARQKAIAVDRYPVTSCHGLIPEGPKFPVCGWRNRAAVAAPPRMLSNPSV